jgi:AraC-like DNA-binding protein
VKPENHRLSAVAIRMSFRCVSLLPRDTTGSPGHNRRVYVWNASKNRKTGHLVHTVAAGHGHALLAPLVTYAFRALRVSAALWEHGFEWFPIHDEPNVQSFEHQHGVGQKRYEYNARSFAQVLERKHSVRGQHAGYSDLFAPILVAGQVAAILVTGPFALTRPTRAAVLERWHWLTGRQGHPADPEFAGYVAATLSTLVLESAEHHTFERLVGCLVRLMAGEGAADEIANEWEHARASLDKVRLVERTWGAVREMVDERSSKGWSTRTLAHGLGLLGLSRLPDSVLVGLTVSQLPNRDPVEEAIQRDAFQRSTVHLARSAGDAIAGQVGDHGVVFLMAAGGPPQRRRRRLRDVAERVTALARHDFGFTLYCGSADAPKSSPIDRSYQAALAAAESALVQGTGRVVPASSQGLGADSLWHLRRDLGYGIEERPDALAARFERYVEAVAARSGYRMEPLRIHLEVGFQRMAEPLLDNVTLGAQGLVTIREGLSRAATVARTTGELLTAYREAVADLSTAVSSPVVARHEHSLRKALDHIHQHFTEPLRLPHVARLAGLSPKYFSRLFAKREGTTFERYVSRMRIERAKQLLASTDLAVGRVAKLSGFNSVQYFCGAFRRSLEVSPLAYRTASGTIK